jgi:glyoxylase-like metal-dependent hydrolase (beta-lactamase superfamily II)
MPDVTVRRVDFGYFVRPPAETGTGQPRVDACLGYVVEHPQGVLLFDTGMGAHPDVDAGEVELLPGVFLLPTPGHTEGHQSLVVRRTDGAVILAGQTHDTATHYAADQLACRARRDGHGEPLPDIAAWLDALQHLDPRIVYFAHDRSVWTP